MKWTCPENVRTRARLLLIAACVLSVLLASGCNSTGGGVPVGTPTPMPTGTTPPVPTPTVDLNHARQVYEAEGELTYAEVIALRQDIVGDPPDPSKYKSDNIDKYYKDQDDHQKKEDAFAAKLEKCKLKDSVGWVAFWRYEYDKNYNDIPDKNRVFVYMYDPFNGAGKELRRGPEMALVDLTDKQVSELAYGQRIQFGGDLALVDGQEAVKNPKYTLLGDDPPIPTPGPNELKDLTITLDRTMCFGTCPNYTLSIGADGKVSFVGRTYTAITGTVTSTIGQDKLVELANQIHEADFFSLDNRYSLDVTDNPTYTLTIYMDGKSKEVVSYATAPRRLTILMDRIDQIVNTAQWIGNGGR